MNFRYTSIVMMFLDAPRRGRSFFLCFRGGALALVLLSLVASGCYVVRNDTSTAHPQAAAVKVLSAEPVPFLLEDNHIQVQAKLNGHEVRLVLDTGASTVLASPAAATAAGLTNGTPIKVNALGGSGRGKAQLCIAESVRVGPAVASEVPVTVMPIPAPFNADGLLGLSFFRPLVLHLDFEHRLLYYKQPANARAEQNSVLRLHLRGPVPTIEAEVDGVPVMLTVDTGAGSALLLNSWSVEQQRLRERYPKRLKVFTGGGITGEMRGEITRLQSLKLGAITLTNVFVEFEVRTNSTPSRDAGFIGMEVLRRFNLTFDFPGERLHLKPNAHFSAPARLPASVRSGMACLPAGTNLVVRDVVPESPAAEAGVRVGDKIVAINGQQVQAMKFEQIKDTFRSNPGTAVRLRLASTNAIDRETTLILRDLL